MLSNESYMNLVMSEVLPTDCSPRNTSLNFRSGLPKSPEVDIFLIAPWAVFHAWAKTLIA